MSMFEYPKIHMKHTGTWLRFICMMEGKSARMIQETLGLTTVQSVYDWFHGRTLPSLDNMCALGQFLGFSVEVLLIGQYGLPLKWFNNLEADEKALFQYKILFRESGSHKTDHRVEEDCVYCRQSRISYLQVSLPAAWPSKTIAM